MQYDERCVQYLMNKCEVSREVALLALQHNKGSVSYAEDSLRDEAFRGMFMREVRESGSRLY